MNRRILLAGVVGLCASLAPSQSFARPAKVFVPGYGECAADAKHAKVPAVKNLIYDVARRKVVALGWKPKVTGKEENSEWLMGQERIFWERGDKEIDACSWGRAYCRFNFVDEFGNWLVVFTVGEEAQERHTRAVATYAALLCPDK